MYTLAHVHILIYSHKFLYFLLISTLTKPHYVIFRTPLDNVDPVCKQVFEQRGIKAVQPGTLTLEELNACIGEYDGMVVEVLPRLLLNFFNMPQN